VINTNCGPPSTSSLHDPTKYINTYYTAAKGTSLSPGSNNRLTSFSVKAPFPV